MRCCVEVELESDIPGEITAVGEHERLREPREATARTILHLPDEDVVVSDASDYDVGQASDLSQRASPVAVKARSN